MNRKKILVLSEVIEAIAMVFLISSSIMLLYIDNIEIISKRIADAELRTFVSLIMMIVASILKHVFYETNQEEPKLISKFRKISIDIPLLMVSIILLLANITQFLTNILSFFILYYIVLFAVEMILPLKYRNNKDIRKKKQLDMS